MREVQQAARVGTRSEYLLLLRFFSGLRELERGKWLPYGPPTICALIEELEKRGVPTDVVLLSRERGLFNARKGPVHIRPECFFHVRFTVYPYLELTGLPRVDNLISALAQSSYCLLRLLKARPKLVYCVRATQLIGAFCANLGVPVVLRMMGESGYYPFFTKRINAVKHPFFYGSLRARFACIIASLDGSRIRPLLEGFSHPRVKKHYLLNGVERGTVATRKTVPGDLNILFVGRFEDQKGTPELISAVSLLAAARGSFRLTIVGYGGKEDEIRAHLSRRGLEDRVTLTGKVAHTRIMELYRSHEVFISLNRYGNLNNTVLEAMSCGCCTIMLGKGADGVDEDTARLIPKDACVTVPREDTEKKLAEALKRLIDDRDLVREYGEKAAAWSLANVPTWRERMDREIDLLRKAAAR